MRLCQSPRCRKVPACLDYDAYVFEVSGGTRSLDLQRLQHAVERLGRVDRASLGVVYIRSDWGYLVLPPPGFPELKVVFGHQVSKRTQQRILDLVAAAITDGWSPDRQGCS